MTSENENVKNLAERILYVDPNDVYGMVNGVPITPDYTDMCISFNLEVTTVPRTGYISGNMSNMLNAETNRMETYNISWTSYQADAKPGDNKVSFMKGKEYGDTSFLTTYYTDINFGDYSNQNIIEGLGVESVTVSFESYYTPTIKIRFIDVRGASLFGREEIAHVDEKITMDSIWGCFFTFPYPQFQLQIKGFYGHPVTYQLTCTDFRANFNSQTGNFEIDVTFLGYDYGILADIPTAYLLAAPYSQYVGAQYWEDHKDLEEWRLSDGNSPKKLFDILALISKAMREENTNENGEDLINGDDGANSIEKGNELKDLTEIQKKYNEIVDYITQGKQCYSITSNNGVYLIFTTQNKEFWKTIETKSEVFFKKIENFIRKYPYDSLNLRKSLLFLGEQRWKGDGRKTSFDWNINAFILRSGFEEKEHSIVINDTRYYFKTYYIISEEDIKDVSVDFDYTKINENFEGIFLGKTEETLQTMINERQKYASDEESKTEEKQEKTDSYFSRLKIYQTAGLVPTIDNVFKTILCHLETLMAMIYECKKRIDDQITEGKRTPEKLGIRGFNLLDFKNNEISKTGVPPWIAVSVTQSKGEEENGTYDSVNSIGWVGDFKGETEWEEAKLIEGLSLAALHVLDNNKQKNKYNTSSDYKIICLPTDMFTEIFPMSSWDNPYSLGEYLGIRAAALFGVVDYNPNTAEALGKADALNFYSKIDRGILKRRFINRDGWKKIVKEAPITDGNTGIEERVYTINPGCEGKFAKILTSDGDNYRYTYTESVLGRTSDNLKGKTKYPMVPVVEGNEKTIMGSEDMSASFISFCDSEGKYRDITASYTTEGEKVKTRLYYRGSTENFLQKNNLFYRIDRKEFENDAMFNIYGGGLLHGYGTFFTDQFTLLDNSSIMVGDFEDKDESWRKTLKEKYWEDLNTEGDYKKDYFMEETVYKEFKWTLPIVSNPNNEPTEYGSALNNNMINVFYSPYYYQQNERVLGENINYDLFREAAKCLLFLSSCGYNIETVINLLSIPQKPSSKEKKLFDKIPYGAMLLVGGLIWRSRQKEDCLKYPSGYGIYQKFETGKFSTFIGNINLSTKENAFSNVTTAQIAYLEKESEKTEEIEKVIVNSDIDNAKFDINVENKLVTEFEYFLKNKWDRIRNKFEEFTEENIPYTYNSMLAYLTGLKSDELNALNNKLRLVIETDTTVESLNEPVYISNSGYNWENKNDETDITFKKSLWDSYVDSFCSKLEEIAKYETTSEDVPLTVTDRDSDIKLAMYMYIKRLWDRWFMMRLPDEFKVSNYMKHFVFMDSLYRNIGSMLHINCEKLYNALANVSGKSMLFQLFSEITTEHNCNFFAFPDYFGFGDDEIEQTNATVKDLDPVSKIADMFKPIPFSRKSALATSNKYVVVLIYKQSENLGDFNSYANDGFDIFSHDNSTLDNIMPTTFNTPAVSPDLKDVPSETRRVRRYGYNIPSFGVTFGRQNNAIFKNISINMSNPIATEQSINALSLIAEKGGASDKTVCFYGQDLFPVYNGYSYTCSIDMMGNAQIMPLMYFQLMNIPMFRGTYMIYSVTHTMRPGEMTTTFKGMKLSRNALPFAKGWYTNARIYVGNDRSFSDGNTLYEDDIPSTWDTEHFTIKELIKSQKAKENGISNVPSTDATFQKLHILMKDCLEKVRAIYGKPMIITSGYRNTEVNKLVGGVTDSQHTKGEAVDIVATDGDLKALFKACVDFGDYDQLIYEHGKTSVWVHISYKKKGNRHEMLLYQGGVYQELDKDNWESQIK